MVLTFALALALALALAFSDHQILDKGRKKSITRLPTFG
jgi:hypothetical protein